MISCARRKATQVGDSDSAVPNGGTVARQVKARDLLAFCLAGLYHNVGAFADGLSPIARERRLVNRAWHTF